MISSASNARGYKANLVLYQDGICNGDVEMMYILAAMELTNSEFKLFTEEV